MAAEVRFEKVSFAYPGRPVFSALELSFPAGITCITGPSGLGKTTLLRLALGLERPSAGRVLAPVSRSAMFQEDRLLQGLNAADNICRLLPEIERSRAEQALMELLEDRQALNKPVWELSGGMSRRVALARAVLPRRELTVLDEPFSGLDRQTKLRAIEYIKRELSGLCVLAVTHDREDIGLLGAAELRLELQPGVLGTPQTCQDGE